MDNKKNKVANKSARPTIPETASTCTEWTANNKEDKKGTSIQTESCKTFLRLYLYMQCTNL